MELFVSFTDAYSVTDAIAYSVTDSDIGAIAHPFTIAGSVAYTLTVAIASYSIHTCIDC